MDNKGKKYHYDNVFTSPLPLEMIDLVQVGEIITQGGYTIDLHDQICSEISYVISGECDFYTGNQVFHAKKGDVHVIGPGVTHKIEAGTENDFRMAYMGFHFKDTETMQEAKAFFERGAMVLKNDKLQLKSTFESILFELHLNRVYSKEILSAYAAELLIRVYRLFHTEAYAEPGQPSNEFRRNYIMGQAAFHALRYIDNNVEDVESVQQVANQLKYNPTYLSRVFSSQTGVALSDYIKAKKVERAKELLKQDVSVDEVAQRLGYSTTQSFSKMFQRYEKCSPSVFRKINMDPERSERE